MKFTIYDEWNIYSVLGIYYAMSRSPLQPVFWSKETVSYFHKSLVFQTEIWINKVCWCSDNSIFNQSRSTQKRSEHNRGLTAK
jgi:hypothetical protein